MPVPAAACNAISSDAYGAEGDWFAFTALFPATFSRYPASFPVDGPIATHEPPHVVKLPPGPTIAIIRSPD